MRASFQILAIPHRYINNEFLFWVFRRAHSKLSQFIVSGKFAENINKTGGNSMAHLCVG